MKLDRRFQTNTSPTNFATNSEIANRTNPISQTRSPKSKVQRKNRVFKKYNKCLRMLKLVDLYLYTNLSKAMGSKRYSKRKSRRKVRVR